MYDLIRFGPIFLPQYDVNFNAGPAPAPLATVLLLGGGVYDAHGSSRSPQQYPLLVSYPCTIIAATDTLVRTELATLKAAIGTRQHLVRQNIPNGAEHWCWARLTDVDDTMRSRRFNASVPVVLTFALLGRWNGEYHSGGLVFGAEGLYFDDGLYFDGSDIYALDGTEGVDQTITVNNGGNIATIPVVNVRAGTASITVLTVGIAGVSEFAFTGTVAIGKTLSILCGPKTVLNDGVGAYSNLALTANHKQADWLVLQPGDNSIIVNRTGGGTGSTVEFVFYNGWA